jgi:hypothetical protein
MLFPRVDVTVNSCDRDTAAHVSDFSSGATAVHSQRVFRESMSILSVGLKIDLQ